MRSRREASIELAIWRCCAPRATGWSLEVFGIAGSLDGDLGGGVLDLAEIVGGECDVGGADVLLQALKPPGAGDRHDPGLLGEQPGEGDLGGVACLRAAMRPSRSTRAWLAARALG